MTTNPTAASGGGELWLRVDDPSEGPSFVCLTSEGVIGRDYRCDVVIHDDEASRMHARVAPRNGGAWVVTDLATTNGTLVNFARIVGPAVLSLGDVIRVGRVSCTVVESADA